MQQRPDGLQSLTYLLPVFFTKKNLLTNSLGDRNSISLKTKAGFFVVNIKICYSFVEGQTGLLPIMKDLNSLSSGFQSCNVTYHMCRYHWLSVHHPVWMGLRDTGKMLIYSPLLLLWPANFVFYSRDSCLPQAYRKLWPTDLLASSRVKILGVSYFLTVISIWVLFLRFKTHISIDCQKVLLLTYYKLPLTS